MKRALLPALLAGLTLTLAACQDGSGPEARMEATPAEDPTNPWATYANGGWNHEGDEVTTTNSGLQYIVLESGPACEEGPTGGDQAFVHYEGRLEDGTAFDSSFERGRATNFPANGVIKGWTEALGMMCPGDDWLVYVPSELGYGDRGAGPVIKAGDDLIFRIILLADIAEEDWSGESFK